MTIEQFEEALREVRKDHPLDIGSDVFELVFSGGPNEVPSRDRAFKLAEKHGLTVSQIGGQVRFAVSSGS